MRLADRDYVEFRRRDRLFDSLAMFESRGAGVTGAGEPVHLVIGSATADFMRVIGIRPMLGRTSDSEDERAKGGPVAVLGNSLWRERFGADPKIVGGNITLDGVDHTIIGVMPPGFAYPDGAQVWMPMEIRPDPHMTMVRPVIGLLKAGVSRQQAQTELQVDAEPGTPCAGSAISRADGFRSPRTLADLRRCGWFVLLIACANVANLLLIRAASRQQEIAVRAALGAGSRRLIRQLLTESTLLSVFAGAAGLLLAMWGVPVLLALAPEGAIPRTGEIHIDATVLAFTFGVSLITGILFGLAPASHIVRHPAAGLVGRQHADRRRHAGEASQRADGLGAGARPRAADRCRTDGQEFSAHTRRRSGVPARKRGHVDCLASRFGLPQFRGEARSRRCWCRRSRRSRSHRGGRGGSPAAGGFHAHGVDQPRFRQAASIRLHGGQAMRQPELFPGHGNPAVGRPRLHAARRSGRRAWRS